eukprot:1160071-Pelagomonas_calceolata.AAC.2
MSAPKHSRHDAHVQHLLSQEEAVGDEGGAARAAWRISSITMRRGHRGAHLWQYGAGAGRFSELGDCVGHAEPTLTCTEVYTRMKNC